MSEPKRYSKSVVIGLSVSLFALIAICLTVTYLWIDRSISLAYAVSGATTTEEAYFEVSTLLYRDWAGMTQDQVVAKLEAEARRHPERDIVIKREPEENSVMYENVRFKFESGRLVGIH